MHDGQVTQRSKTSPVVNILVGIVVLVLCGGAAVWIFSVPGARGEKIGTTSLTEPGASIAVEGKPGESLFFRVDASIGIPLLTLVDDDHLEHEASELLRKSQLTVVATSPSGAPRTATCSVCNGTSATTSSITGTYSRSGMLNNCVIPIDAPGRWTVRGSVVWAPATTLRSATLETRREAAAR